MLRHGARTLLAQAIEAEVATFLESHADLAEKAGRRRLVRNGFLPERTIQTGIGEVPVRQPRVRGRGPAAADARIRFASSILPRYLRRTRSLDEALKTPGGRQEPHAAAPTANWPAALSAP